MPAETGAPTTLLTRLAREVAMISLEQHHLARRRRILEQAITGLRTGAPEEVIAARIAHDLDIVRNFYQDKGA